MSWQVDRDRRLVEDEIPSEAFVSLPRLPELVTLASKPNAVLLLGVEERELSWTSFLAWLLDPERSGRLAGCALGALVGTLQNHPATHSPHEQAREPLLRLGSGGLQPLWSKAEVTHGDARFDVLAGVSTQAGNVRLLIENKIRAGESARQMDRYVVEAQKSMLPGTVLLPLFVALGSEPPVGTSCAWALVLDRGQVHRWLHGARERGSAERVATPPLLQDYIDLLELWTLADGLRRTHWREIEAIGKSDPKPEGWDRVQRWLSVGNEGFYAAVGSSPELARVFQAHDMRSNTFGSTLSQTIGFQFYKPDWTIGEPLAPKGVDVHYESARRGELFVHVEINPYEGSIDQKPERRTALARPLASKEQLQRRIRARLSALAAENPWMGATLRRCGDPARAGTLAAIKFAIPRPEDERTPEACAAFFARIIEQTAGIIDEEVRVEREQL